MVYMALSLYLNAHGRKGVLTGPEKVAFWWKKVLFTLNVSSCVISLHFYRQHNMYCFPMSEH